MLTYPWKCTVLHCNHLGNTWKPLVPLVQFYIVTTWETPGNLWCWWPNTLIITLASAQAIIKVSGHQHQWLFCTVLDMIMLHLLNRTWTEWDLVRRSSNLASRRHFPQSLEGQGAWYYQKSQRHEMYYHDLEVMSSKPGRVELGVRGTSVLSRTWNKNVIGEHTWYLGTRSYKNHSTAVKPVLRDRSSNPPKIWSLKTAGLLRQVNYRENAIVGTWKGGLLTQVTFKHSLS